MSNVFSYQHFSFLLKRSNIQENVELIKLQREVKDKVTKLQHLQGKYQNLEEVILMLFYFQYVVSKVLKILADILLG